MSQPTYVPQERSSSQQPPTSQNASVSPEGIQVAGTTLSWDGIVSLLVAPSTTTFLPTGHPLSVAVACLHTVKEWKRNPSTSARPALPLHSQSQSHVTQSPLGNGIVTSVPYGVKSDGSSVDLICTTSNEALCVYWDHRMLRPVNVSHDILSVGLGVGVVGSGQVEEFEKIEFPPGTHYKVIRAGVEVFPWDGIGPGNDWLRGQLMHVPECRCGVFHFRHTNAGFKRPAVIREHLASCTTTEAVPESLRKLCTLQRDAEKMGTKRKREEARNGDNSKMKRPRFSNSSGLRTSLDLTPPGFVAVGEQLEVDIPVNREEEGDDIPIGEALPMDPQLVEHDRQSNAHTKLEGSVLDSASVGKAVRNSASFMDAARR